MNSKIKKSLKISGITLGSIAGVFALLIASTAMISSIAYNKFYSNSKKEFRIPGLNKDYIPQGFDYVEGEGYYLMSAYNKNKEKASAIFLINGKEKKEVKLQNEDGSIYKKHAGGVAMHGDYIYVAGSKKFDVFKSKDFLKAKNGESIKSIGSFKTLSNSSYAYIDPSTNIIYSGEFEYAKGGYKTDTSHHITTKAGDKNTAFAVGYRLSSSFEFGIDPTPVEAISLPSYAQGMCFTNDYAVLSTSWGINTSRFYFYSLKKLKEEDKIKLGDYEIPYYVFDSSTLEKVVNVPPMSEEMDYVDGKIVYVTESASSKYIFGKWTGGYYARGYYSN